MIRTATAQWRGDGMTGTGTLTTQSGAFTAQPYSFKTRFGDEEGKSGTNPEELIAAAHSGCFTMALSFALAKAGFTAEQLETEALVDVKPSEAGFSIVGITLKLKAQIPGVSDEQFQELAAGAKANCPISKALASVPITLEATLA
ncbi:OsmC family peroxiredoxin [Asticcacaulis sp. BYS171W]|uniref:OsmC family peroxiredoxin n=1 Tax=Asticcacaulis aquaticus TaxID=2984212 RepID=A0ABT5HY51_9CAUL|nr:OsmC family peroxiredoxin [Asticcacaulis aquaticus]MDC7685005.1 OsmC family peroxiredoxin [Asticcacaulis aquaticus]